MEGFRGGPEGGFGSPRHIESGPQAHELPDALSDPYRRIIEAQAPGGGVEKPVVEAKDFILTPDEVETALEGSRSLERGMAHPIIITYPSGLRFVLNPVFDGRPSLESFTGGYYGHLLAPSYYDQNATEPPPSKIDLTDFTQIPIDMTLAAQAFPPATSRAIPRDEPIMIVPSGRFAATRMNFGIINQSKGERFLLVDLDELQASEQHMAAVFHELGHHALFGPVEDDMLTLALNESGIMSRKIPETALTASLPATQKKHITAMAEALKPLREQLKAIPEITLTKIFALMLKDPVARKSVYRFHERTAWAKGRMTMRDIANEHGVSFQFNPEKNTRATPLSKKPVIISSKKLRTYESAALQTYADAFKDPSFV